MEQIKGIKLIDTFKVKRRKRFLTFSILAVALAFILMITLVSLQNHGENYPEKSKLIPNVASETLKWNGNDLIDRTVFDEESNTCHASNLGMEIEISPCVAQDADGKNIEQYVDFEWTGSQSQQTGWIFVYDEGTLDNAKLEILQNVSEEVSYTGSKWVTATVNDVISYQDLGTPDQRCELGNQNNTQMFSVTKTANQTNSTTQIYCFTDVQILSESSFKLSGNIDATLYKNETSEKWIDVSSSVNYLGYGLLDDQRSYYEVQNVEFSPGELIQTRWTYSPSNVSLKGKWHIVGYDSSIGLTSALAQNKYIYVDPWWDASWNYKREITVTETSGSTLTNYQTLIYVPYNAHMNSDFSDLRFLDSTESTELNYWIENKSDSNYAWIWVKIPSLTASSDTSIFMYYGNSGASSNEDIQNTFILGDSFDDASVDFTTRWQSASQGSYSTSGSKLVMADISAVSDAICSQDTFNNKTITYVISTLGDATDVYSYHSSVGSGAITQTEGIRIWEGSTRYFLNSGGGNTEMTPDPSNWTAWFKSTFQQKLNYAESYDINNQSDFVSRSVAFSTTNPYLCFFSWVGTQSYIDYVYIREQATTEPTYSIGAEQVSNGVLTTLISPEDGFITNNPSIDFQINAIAEGSTSLVNSTIFVWFDNGTLAYSNTVTGLSGNQSLVNWSNSFGDGDYLWTATTFGDDGSNSTASNDSFTIDTQIPYILINEPQNGSEFVTASPTYNVTLNSSIIENNPDSCWYNNGTANKSFSCNSTVYEVFDHGWQNVIFYVNDTAGNINSNSTTFLINYEVPDLIIENSVIEGQDHTVNLTITADQILTTDANVSYNGTYYAMDLISNNGTFALFSKEFTAPSGIAASLEVPIFATYSVDGSSFNTSTENQTIEYLSPIIVSASCDDKAMKFDIKNEQNQSALTINLDYNLQFGIANSTQKTVYGSLTGVSTFYVCINQTLGNYTVGSGELQYAEENGNYVERRYYLFANKTLSNQTENVTLYDLPNGDATSFLFEASQSDLSPYVGKYLGLLRWYPEFDSYERVEMAKTDEDGRSIMRVKVEDVDYRVALWDTDGSLINMQDPTRFACLTSPCTYSFDVAQEQDFTSATGIDGALTFNETSNKFTYIWSDPSQLTQSMTMNVTRKTGVSVGVICSQTVSGAAGAVSCDVTGYTGTLEAVIYRTASPAVPIDSLSYTVGQAISTVASDFGLFMSALLAIIGFFVGIFNPILGVLMQVVSLIVPVYLGAITIQILIGVAVMGIVIIHFMKRVIGG